MQDLRQRVLAYDEDAAEADYEMLEGTGAKHGHVHPLPDGFTSVSPLRAFSYTPFISPCSTSFTVSHQRP